MVTKEKMMIRYLLAAILIASTGTAFAASGGSPNGKPFVEINGQIDEVQGELRSLSERIERLEFRTDSLSLSCTTISSSPQQSLITMGGSTYPGDTWSLEVTSPVLRDVTYTVTRADVAGCNACNAAQNWITLINTDPVMEGLVFARYLGGSGKSLGITIEGRQPGTSIEFTVRATDNSPYQVGQGTTPIFAELEELQSAVESQCPEGTVETGQCKDQVLNDCQSICCSISTGD